MARTGYPTEDDQYSTSIPLAQSSTSMRHLTSISETGLTRTVVEWTITDDYLSDRDRLR
jgi:hypothetical protein